MYQQTDAEFKQAQAIDQALETRDIEAMYRLAAEIKEQGDDEEAERFIKIAQRWNHEDWAHDEANNN